MDALKFLRTQVNSRLTYLESAQVVADATYPEMSNMDRFEALTIINGKAIALREILADIDALTITTPTAG